MTRPRGTSISTPSTTEHLWELADVARSIGVLAEQQELSAIEAREAARRAEKREIRMLVLTAAGVLAAIVATMASVAVMRA